MKYSCLLLLFILLGIGNIEAQHRAMTCGHQHVPGKTCPGIMGLPENIDAFTPPPSGYQPGADRAVSIQVTYNGFTFEAQQAFQYAVDIWASLLTSNVTIFVDATWEDIPGNTLGFAGATGYYQNVPGEDPNVYFPSALADKLAGFDYSPGNFDLTASFDSGTNWYLGTDGNTPNNQYDLVSVVLHELGHGLGVAGTGSVQGNTGFIGFSGNSTPSIYDVFVEDNGGTPILNYTNGTVALGSALTSNGLYWNGASGVAVGNTEPRLYAPGVWEQGSSYSHLNENTYLAGDINSLMTPSIANSEAIHDPGPIVMGMMEDMGWTVENNGGGICELTTYQLVVDPDCYGGETTWILEQVGVGEIAGGGPYQRILPDGQATQIIDLCLEDGCYQLIINDSFQDGLAGSLEDGCDVDGDIYVLDQNGAEVAGIPQVNFGAQTTLEFCVGQQEECTPGEMEFIDLGCQDQGEGSGALPALEVRLAFTGDCFVEELCFTTNTGGSECYDLLSLDPPLIVENGGGVFLTDLDENTLHTFTYTLTNGETGGPQSFQTQSCSVAGCTDPGAINYEPNATIDDGSCEYNCAVTDIELSQNCAAEGSAVINRILVNVNVFGGCLVETVCYQPQGTNNETCFSMSANDIELGDGDGVFIPVAEGPGTYEVWVETEFGVMSLTEIVSIDCTDAIPVCDNPFAVNYDPIGTFIDNTTCIYDESICDCDGNQHTIGAMAWLDDDYLDEGGTEYLWDGQAVNFNCLTWGFDCGDANPDSTFDPADDPNGVCDGNLPPNNGCDAATCAPLGLEITQEPCNTDGTNPIVVIGFEAQINGGCVIEDFCLQVDGGGYTCFPLQSLDNPLVIGDGEEFTLNGATPGAFYEFYYTTDDGTTSPIFTWLNGDCSNEATICDCAGTQHNIGVLTWLGDDELDNGGTEFLWDGQTVDFDCITWGFDCGDGGVNNDPNGVCDGNLPPNNGCVEEVLGCTDSTAINYNPTATIEDGSCIYDILGCSNPNACNYDESATIDDGSCDYESCAGCTDANASNYDQNATIDDGSCVYDCEYPTLTWESVNCDGTSGTFYVDMAVADLGNGSPYSVTNNVNADEIILNFIGTVQIGPFNIGEQVVVTVTSEIYPGCFLSSPVMTCTTLMVDELAEINYSLFPNPANDELTIEFDEELQLQTIEILDQSGRIVKSFQDERAFSRGLVRVKLNDLSSGVYTFRLIGQMHAVSARVMINH